MHILHLSKRNGRAQERLLAAAKALAHAAEIDPALVDALSPKTKDPAVRAMMEREAVADLLEKIAITAGVMDPRDLLPTAEELTQDVTTVTPVEEPAPEETPAPTAEEINLPEPVLEESVEPRAQGGVVDGSHVYLIDSADPKETFVPTQPVDEEDPAEKPITAKKSSAKNRTTKK